MRRQHSQKKALTYDATLLTSLIQQNCKNKEQIGCYEGVRLRGSGYELKRMV